MLSDVSNPTFVGQGPGAPFSEPFPSKTPDRSPLFTFERSSLFHRLLVDYDIRQVWGAISTTDVTALPTLVAACKVAADNFDFDTFEGGVPWGGNGERLVLDVANEEFISGVSGIPKAPYIRNGYKIIGFSGYEAYKTPFISFPLPERLLFLFYVSQIRPRKSCSSGMVGAKVLYGTDWPNDAYFEDKTAEDGDPLAADEVLTIPFPEGVTIPAIASLDVDPVAPPAGSELGYWNFPILDLSAADYLAQFPDSP